MVYGVARPMLYPPCYNTCSAPYCMHFDNQLANCNTVLCKLVGTVKVEA